MSEKLTQAIVAIITVVFLIIVFYGMITIMM